MVMEHLGAATVNQEFLLLLAFGVEPKRQSPALMVRGHEALMPFDDTIVPGETRDVSIVDVIRVQFARRREVRRAISSLVCHCYSPCNSL